jgi:hypothetical protein
LAQLNSADIVQALNVSGILEVSGIPIYIGYGVGVDPVKEMAESKRYKLIGNIP